MPYPTGVRSDYLENLGITELPKTIDEFYDFCYRLTYEDPDQNGQDDTWALQSPTTIRDFYGMGSDLWVQQDDGTVIFYGTTENYKEYLKQAKRFVEAGLVDPERDTDNDDTRRGKFYNGRVAMMRDDLDYYSRYWGASAKNKFEDANPGASIVLLDPFVSGDGNAYLWQIYPVCIQGASFAFGADCSDEVMKKVMQIKNDLVADPEFYLRCQYGEQGVHWDYDENGIARVFSDVAEEDKDPLVGSFFAAPPTPKSFNAFLLPPEDVELYSRFSQANYTPMYCEMNFYTNVENKAYSEKWTDGGTIWDETTTKMVKGEIDIDEGWEPMIQQLNELGLQEIIDGWNAILN
jgi:putative aldouronate transport system substrate-binding protein